MVHFKSVLFAFILFAVPVFLSAQTSDNAGWFFLSHKQKLSNKWNLLFDAQVRSTDKLEYVNTLLLRSALSYTLNKQHAVALGYAFKNDWEHKNSKISIQPEHRIYQQYLFQTDLGKTEFTARARFEQRFVKAEEEYRFSQRARVFLAFQVPVIANKDFSKGIYLNFQNEFFATVTNQQNVNNEFFDQNRLLGSAGYRWSKKLDTEIGYMWWRQSDMDGYSSTNVFQLMITTEL